MRFLTNLHTVDFMGRRRVLMVMSGVLVLISLASFAVRGFNFGIDFTGGILVEVEFSQPAELGVVRGDLHKAGFGDASVQYFGTSRDVMIRLGPQSGASTTAVSDSVLSALKADNAGTELRRVEFVGPEVGDQLATQGSLALIYTLIGVLIYVMFRFQWRFSVGAVLALFHDVIITAGVFSLFHLQFDLTVLAALLAIVGYSVNDTIVVYDRVRENFPRMRKVGVIEIFNTAITQTMSRTIITSLTVVLVLIALLVLGGDTLFYFSLAMLIGTVFGTYSSIFVASALTVELGISREDMLPKPKTEQDEMP